MRSALWMTVSFLALPLTACQAPEPVQQEQSVEALDVASNAAVVRGELEARIDAYEMAAMGGDLATMNGLWTEDVRLLEPGMEMSGAAEVSAFYEELFGGGATVQEIDIRIADVFAHGDVAYTMGDYEETFTMSTGAEPMSVHNNWFARWERGADGVWRIDRMVVGSVEAPEGM